MTQLANVFLFDYQIKPKSQTDTISLFGYKEGRTKKAEIILQNIRIFCDLIVDGGFEKEDICKIVTHLPRTST